jgi:ATP-binding cassette subfamily C protein
MNIIFEKLGYDYIISKLSLFVMYFIVIMFTFPLESVFLPKLYGLLFEGIKNTKEMPSVFNFVNNVKQMNIPGVMTIITFAWFIITTSHSIKHRLESMLSPHYLGFIRNTLFTAIIKQGSTDYKDIKIGDMITRILDSSRYLKQIGQWFISQFLPELIGLLSIVIYTFFIDTKIGIILSIGILNTIISSYYGGSHIINLSSAREKTFYHLSEKLNDSFSNMMNIFLNNEDENESSSNKDMNDTHSDVMTDQMLAECNVVLFMQAISIIIYSVALFTTYNLFKNKKLKIAGFISTILILGNYLSFMLSINHKMIAYFCSTYGNVHSSKEFLQKVLRETNIKGKSDFITSGNISFNNVDFKYGKNFIFKDFNIKIKGGQKTAIMGSSGSGKTTLMKMLVQIHRPNNGTITIDNVDILESDVAYLRENVTYVNQRTLLFNKPVIDNILYGNNDIKKEEVEKLMKKYELNSVYSKLNEGIKTSAGVNGNNLSLGMQKVTILLRGILKKGKIIIFDEPLAGLDGTTRGKVMKMIDEECRNKTTIVITHDKEILPYMDTIINLNKYKHV